MSDTVFVQPHHGEKEHLPFYVTTIGTTASEKKIYRPDGMDSWLFLYTRTGQGTVKIYDDIFNLSEGMLVVLPPEILHDYHVIGDGWETSWVTFKGWAVERLLNVNAGVWRITEKSGFNSCFSRLLDAAIEKKDQSTESAGLYELLLEFKKMVFQGSAVEYTLDSRLSRCLNYIEKNYDKTIETETLSKIYGVTAEHFCRMFKRSMGVRPFEYITGVRIRRAKEYLYGQKELSVGEISALTGFQNVSYFCMVFKRNTGMSPTAYRNMSV